MFLLQGNTETSLRGSSPIWASEAGLARTRERAAKPRGAEERRACNDLSFVLRPDEGKYRKSKLTDNRSSWHRLRLCVKFGSQRGQIGTENLFQPSKQTGSSCNSRKENIACRG